MTTLDFVGNHQIDPAGTRAGIAVIQLHDDLWRVTRLDGEVVGYIDRTETPSGSRYRAKRMLQHQRRFIAVGEFWEFDDAMDCFRF